MKLMIPTVKMSVALTILFCFVVFVHAAVFTLTESHLVVIAVAVTICILIIGLNALTEKDDEED